MRRLQSQVHDPHSCPAARLQSQVHDLHSCPAARLQSQVHDLQSCPAARRQSQVHDHHSCPAARRRSQRRQSPYDRLSYKWLQFSQREKEPRFVATTAFCVFLLLPSCCSSSCTASPRLLPLLLQPVRLPVRPPAPVQLSAQTPTPPGRPRRAGRTSSSWKT